MCIFFFCVSECLRASVSVCECVSMSVSVRVCTCVYASRPTTIIIIVIDSIHLYYNNHKLHRFHPQKRRYHHHTHHQHHRQASPPPFVQSICRYTGVHMYIYREAIFFSVRNKCITNTVRATPSLSPTTKAACPPALAVHTWFRAQAASKRRLLLHQSASKLEAAGSIGRQDLPSGT